MSFGFAETLGFGGSPGDRLLSVVRSTTLMSFGFAETLGFGGSPGDRLLRLVRMPLEIRTNGATG